MTGVTQILASIERGEPQAAEQLLPLVYDELRRLAAAKLAHEKPGQTLEATALVHEAWIRLVGGGKSEVGSQKSEEHMPTSDTRPPTSVGWDSRGHFFAAAATAMRRILIENARRKGRLKHGGLRDRVALADLPQSDEDERLLELDKSLTELATEDSQAAQVVELHHFAGLSHEQVAETLGITVYQARQKWTYARAWLLNALLEK